jgi:hypothetical protein
VVLYADGPVSTGSVLIGALKHPTYVATGAKLVIRVVGFTTVGAADRGVPIGVGTAALDEMPTDGMTLDGSPLDGTPTDGSPLDGEATDGSPLDGEATDGSPLDGEATAGSPLDGMILDGSRPDDGETDGSPLDGMTTGGSPLDGLATDGRPLDGLATDGSPLDGVTPDGALMGALTETLLGMETEAGLLIEGRPELGEADKPIGRTSQTLKALSEPPACVGSPLLGVVQSAGVSDPKVLGSVFPQ